MDSALTPKMNSEKMDNFPEDIISSLPEALITHILSFLSIEEAALTSVLSKKWRYLFAFVPNLVFRESFIPYFEKSEQEMDEIRKRFMDFVDRILTLQGNATVKKVCLRCIDDVDPASVTRWILNVLNRGVLVFGLVINSEEEYRLRLKALVSSTLVKLVIITDTDNTTIDVDDVFLPNLKTLHLCRVEFGNSDNVFGNLSSGFPILEELVLDDVYSDILSRSVSVFSKTLKKLYLRFTNPEHFSLDSVSFDTPNLIFLEYFDVIAEKYPKVNFGSLAEAYIDLVTVYYQNADEGYEDLVCSATHFLMGIRNVKILHLFPSTLEVFALCCQSMLIFNNLIHLTIKDYLGNKLESLPAFLKSCPNLETLVFDAPFDMGMFHRRDADWCLSSSQAKVLIIRRFGKITPYVDNLKEQMKQVKHFMDTMPNLEQITLYHTLCEEDVIDVYNQLQMHPKVASSNCKIQMIFSSKFNYWIPLL